MAKEITISFEIVVIFCFFVTILDYPYGIKFEKQFGDYPMQQ